MPRLDRVIETALHVADMERACRFYEDVLELPMIVGDQRFAAFDVGGKSILLLFLEGGSTEPIQLPGGIIPPHDGYGHLHFAFAVAAAELPKWEERLHAHNVEIVSRVHWPLGGTSIYFHDPDGHVLELATPGVWPTY